MFTRTAYPISIFLQNTKIKSQISIILIFLNDYDFRKSISSAASSVCSDLNHDSFFDRDDITLKTYSINSLILPQRNARTTDRSS